MSVRFEDAAVRQAAFEWLAEQVELHGDDVLPRKLLAQGFRFRGERVPMLGPQGIFKPRVIPEIPLSITTTVASPYEDALAEDGLLLYRYRGEDPFHHENVGLREAMRRQVPLVYFHAVAKGWYLASWPVFVERDDPARLTFTVAVDDARALSLDPAGEGGVSDIGDHARRQYITRSVRQRVHQRTFRERVLRAYREQCAICRLRHRELLDAAHIIPDREEGGEPRISNGLSLCKIHHAAFDRLFIGVRPDHVIEVRRDLLDEEDGPMLLHGLQGLHGEEIQVPRRKADRPDPRHLEERYERFREAG